MDALKARVVERAEHLGMDLCGVADARVANEEAPPGFTPEDQLPGAKAIVVFGQRVSLGVFLAPNERHYHDIYYPRTEWSTYESLDATAHHLTRLLDVEAGYPSVQIPTNDPLLVDDGRLRGVVSLKHLGQLAGLGAIGRNSLLIHPKHGNVFRLGGIITRAPLPPDDRIVKDPCPGDCTACRDVCPEDAIRDRSIDVVSCMKRSVGHPLLRPFGLIRLLFRMSRHSEAIRRLVQGISNQIVSPHYTEPCNECVRACPYFKKALKKGAIRNEHSSEGLVPAAT